MGDRANIVIKQHPYDLPEGQPNPRIYLYTHWTGYDLPRTLQDALKRGRDRWDDEPYLGRIIFNEMTKGQERKLTGFGISTYEGDGGYALLVVDSEARTVTVEGDARYGGGLALSFENYCDLDLGDAPWEALQRRVADSRTNQAA